MSRVTCFGPLIEWQLPNYMCVFNSAVQSPQALQRLSDYSTLSNQIKVVRADWLVGPAYSSVAMVYGGPVSAIWGWPLVCMMSFIVSLAMAEICR